MNELVQEIIQFRDERDWLQFNNYKDLSISLSLEASELLEKFQWKTSDEAVKNDPSGIREELADVLIYGLMLAHDLNVDPEVIIKDKLTLNRAKYPMNKAKGSKEKYKDL